MRVVAFNMQRHRHLRDTELLDPAGFDDALGALVVECKDTAYARWTSFMLPRN